MDRQKYLELKTLEDAMVLYIESIFLLEWDDDADCIRYANDKNSCLEWDDYEFVEFYNDIPYEDDYIDGLLFFGDGTIEFRFKSTCEAENWANFDNVTIISVINELKQIDMAR
jgi:hypothetical protein